MDTYAYFTVYIMKNNFFFPLAKDCIFPQKGEWAKYWMRFQKFPYCKF